MSEFFVYPNSANHSDILHVVGLADIIKELYGDAEIEFNGYYKVLTKKQNAKKTSNGITPGFRYIIKKLETENKTFFSNIIGDKMNLDEQFSILKKIKKKREQGKKSSPVTSEDPEILELEVEPNFSLHQIIHSKPNWFGDSKLYSTLLKIDTLPKLVEAWLKEYNHKTTELSPHAERKNKLLEKNYSSSLFLNPHLSKGANNPKGTSIALKSFSKTYINWFTEWMKYRGLENCAIGSEHNNTRRVMVIIPKRIKLAQLKKLRDSLNTKLYYNNSVKLENQAILGLIKILIENWEIQETKNKFSDLFAFEALSDCIKGLKVSLYRDMGNVYAPFRSYELSIPSWFIVNSSEDQTALLQICEEFLEINYTLKEEHSDEINLLLALRSFFCSNSLTDLFTFFSGYGQFLMNAIGANKKYAPRVSITALDTIFTRGFKMKLKNIVEDTGFKNIATAIRKATISGQLQKSMDKKLNYEIHYGLSQDWKKVVRIPDKFVEKLCEFIQRYNQENARKMEQSASSKVSSKQKYHRKLITTDDLNSVMKLLDNYGTERVGMLLLAYGYAREESKKFKEENK